MKFTVNTSFRQDAFGTVNVATGGGMDVTETVSYPTQFPLVIVKRYCDVIGVVPPLLIVTTGFEIFGLLNPAEGDHE